MTPEERQLLLAEAKQERRKAMLAVLAHLDHFTIVQAARVWSDHCGNLHQRTPSGFRMGLDPTTYIMEWLDEGLLTRSVADQFPGKPYIYTWVD